MKSKLYGIGLFTLLVALGHSAAAAAVPRPDQTVRDFVAAGDAQNATQMEKLLHDNFRVLFVTKGKPGSSVLSRAQYLDMVRAKKVGGDARKLTIVKSEIHDSLAFVRVRIQGKQANFEALQTLIHEGDRWLLVADDVVFEPKP